jgi:GNAT superfamily N-acetyltransferase
MIMRRAVQADVDAIVAMLADDGLGAARDQLSDGLDAAYPAAFDRIDADPRNLLMVAQEARGEVVGTLQMTFVPGLSNHGAELALVKAVRVASSRRGQGLGGTMMAWAMDEARRRGCRYVELTSHASRTDAQRFYERLGFERSHVGMKRAL